MADKKTTTLRKVETAGVLDEIFNGPSDVAYQDVQVPEWGISLRLRSLTVGEMLEYIKANEEEKKANGDTEEAGIKLLVRSLVDSTGAPIGTSAMIDKFKSRNSKVVMRLIKAAQTLSGLRDEEKAAVKNG